jgi:cytochrome c5
VLKFSNTFHKPLLLASLLLSSGLAYAEAVDDYTLDLYQTYCESCHSLEGTGAPIAFDPAQWEEGLSKGREQVINNAITGAGNMPAMGGCMECAYEDFEDLIDYMTSPK